jgi:hypothetical protein
MQESIILIIIYVFIITAFSLKRFLSYFRGTACVAYIDLGPGTWAYTAAFPYECNLQKLVTYWLLNVHFVMKCKVGFLLF